MRVIRASDYRRMPWKNGGGVTSEVLVEPHPSDASRFTFRISLADVASDGPFSRFDGYDRHIMLVDGAGMTLDCGAHGTIALARHEPRSFSGDWDVTGTLTSGPVRDLNLIVDRAVARGMLAVRDVAGTTTLGSNGSCIVHVLEGELEGASAGDTIVGDGELAITGTAKVLLAYIGPR